MYRFTKKNFSTVVFGKTAERKGKYIVCPGCQNKRSYLLTETEPGKKINWRCSKCMKDWGGVIQKDGTVDEMPFERARKWILVEIDADCQPQRITSWRTETDEEALKRTVGDEAAKKFTVPQSFTLTECDSDPNINPLGFPQYTGVAT